MIELHIYNIYSFPRVWNTDDPYFKLKHTLLLVKKQSHLKQLIKTHLSNYSG